MEGYKEFVNSAVYSFDEESFQSVKRSLVDEYLEFSFFKDENITREILAEKLCDYFEKVELKTFKPFSKQVQEYIDNLKKLVEDYIAEEPKQKKKEKAPMPTPRARVYYEEAISIRDPQKLSLRKLIDYSRIMFCLYSAIIENNHKTIDDFDYAADCLMTGRIIGAMKREKNRNLLKVKSKTMFNTEELYSIDTCTFVLTFIMLNAIADERR